MSSSRIKTLGHVLVLPHTDRWSSTIVHRAKDLPVEVRTFETVSQLAAQLNSYPNAVLVIELSKCLLEFKESLRRIWRQAIELGTPVVAVGDYSTQDQRIELIQAGFAEAFSSTAEAPRLLDLAVNHLKQRRIPNSSIEKRVERDLPWSADAV